MPVRARADVVLVELPPVRSDVYLEKYILLHLHKFFTSEDQKYKYTYTKIHISLEHLRLINMQRTSAIECFHLHHCQCQPHSFVFLTTFGEC